MNYKELLNHLETEIKKGHPDWDNLSIKKLAVLIESRCFDAPCDNCDTEYYFEDESL